MLDISNTKIASLILTPNNAVIRTAIGKRLQMHRHVVTEKTQGQKTANSGMEG